MLSGHIANTIALQQNTYCHPIDDGKNDDVAHYSRPGTRRTIADPGIYRSSDAIVQRISVPCAHRQSANAYRPSVMRWRWADRINREPWY